MTKDQLQSEYDSKVGELEGLTAKLAEIEAEKTELAEGHKTLGEENAELKSQLEAAQLAATEKEALAEQLNAMEQAATELQEKHDAQAVELEAAKTRISELEELVAGSEPLSGKPGDAEPVIEDRNKIIADYAKANGLSEFAATIKLSRLRPELWAKA